MDKNKCISCGEAPRKCSCKNKDFTKAVIEIDNPPVITNIRKVVIPASMGDDTTVPPVTGKYHNVLLNYEANNKSYLYSSDGVPTLLSGAQGGQDPVTNLSVVFDDSSWGTPSEDYRVLTGSGETTIGVCNLSAAQGNAGLFVNDDTGEFVTVGEAYELIASGERVKFNNVPVGQYLNSPHTYSGNGEDVFSGIELPVKYFINIDGVYVTEYTNSVVLPRSKGVPPLGISIQKIDQDDPEEDTYEFIIQGKM